MEQSGLCSATLLYIHSLIGVREEKRWKMCEKQEILRKWLVGYSKICYHRERKKEEVV
jgi:hypothetical protein